MEKLVLFLAPLLLEFVFILKLMFSLGKQEAVCDGVASWSTEMKCITDYLHFVVISV